jgi:endonuclease V-like protein UPF0215 family
VLRDALRTENRAALEGLSVRERIALCTMAGQQQLELYARHHGLEVEEARAILERNKQRGRTPCSFLDTP